jgi:hypothetical protein
VARRLFTLPAAAVEAGVGYAVLRRAVEDGVLPLARDERGDPIEFVGVGEHRDKYVDESDLRKFERSHASRRPARVGRDS